MTKIFALCVVGLLAGSPAWAAGFVAGTLKQGANPIGTTPAINTTGANLCLVVQTFYTGSTIGTPTDNKSNTYTFVVSSTTPDTNYRVEIYYVLNPTVGSGHTFSTTSNNGTLIASCYSSVSAAPTATHTTNNGTGTTIQPGSITPGANNHMLVTAIVSQDSVAATYAVSAPFTLREAGSPVSGQSEGGALADDWQSTATATNPTWSGISGTGEVAALMIDVPMTSAPPSNSASNRLLLGVGQ